MMTAASRLEPGRRGSAKRRTSLLGLLAVPLVTLGVWIVAPTSAGAIGGASCSGLDTSCLTQSVRNEAGDTTRSASDAVRDVADDVDGAVQGTVGAVERVIGEPGSSGIGAPGVGGDPSQGPGGAHDGGGGKPQDRRDEHAGRPARRSSDVGTASLRDPSRKRSPLTSFASPSSEPGTADPAAGASAHGGLGLGRIATDIGRRAAVPLALLLVLAMAFVALQGRLDRTDPKLHLSSVDEEVSRFR